MCKGKVFVAHKMEVQRGVKLAIMSEFGREVLKTVLEKRNERIKQEIVVEEVQKG